MIIKKLRLRDFRVFSGVHEIDLEPKKKYGRHAPIVLFGGLNGAGKTSILTAIRLSLYGRHIENSGTSRRNYEKVLRDYIHKSPSRLIQPNSSMVELIFQYASKGVIQEFTVRRSWVAENDRLEESLRILVDGKELTNLNDKEAQSFVLELIPIGIADLFFFDGEKIQAIAEDSEGNALLESTNRLLGIDLVKRLIADLEVLRKKKEKSTSDEAKREEILLSEQKLEELELQSQNLLHEFETHQAEYLEKSANQRRLEIELQTEGGEWNKSRDQHISDKASYQERKSGIEEAMRAHIAGDLPFCLMPNFISKLQRSLTEEGSSRRRATFVSEAGNFIAELRASLSDNAAKQTVDEFWKSYKQSDLKSASLTHDVTDKQSIQIQEKLGSITQVTEQFADICYEHSIVETKLDDLGVSLSRAPSSERLKHQFKELTDAANEIASLKSHLRQTLETRKQVIFSALTEARKLRDLHSKLSESASKDRAYNLAQEVTKVLGIFKEDLAKQKIESLEYFFNESFASLSRKVSRHLRAKIDPLTFIVSLHDSQENLISREELSAGEKQIYAISMLSALGKTTRRNLPIVIDTPLGRLDSHHRQKLAVEYLPYASQQVIVLSTDTEVDEGFYKQLEPSISHSYELCYQEQEASTVIKPGYFWRTDKGEVA